MQQKLMAVIRRLHVQTFLSLEPTTSYSPREWRAGHRSLYLAPRPRTVAGPPQVLMLRWYELRVPSGMQFKQSQSNLRLMRVAILEKFIVGQL